MATLISETGDILVQETVLGVPGASTLNDTSLQAIFTENFTTNPVDRSWVIGNNWSWSEANGNME